VRSLIELGYNGEANDFDLLILLKYITPPDNENNNVSSKRPEKAGTVNYRDFLANLRDKPFGWWQKTIVNNAFVLRHRDLATEGIRRSSEVKFYINLIAEKVEG